MARFSITLMVAILVVLPGTAPALAHKLKVFATAIGAGVEGRVYFVGGGAALDVPVALTDSTGTVTATARTQSPDGSFVLTLPYRDDFTLTADAQDGHVAAFSLRSNRLSDTLPSAPHAIVADAQSAAQAQRRPKHREGAISTLSNKPSPGRSRRWPTRWTRCRLPSGCGMWWAVSATFWVFSASGRCSPGGEVAQMSRVAAAGDLFVESREGRTVAGIDPRIRLAVCLVFLICLPLLNSRRSAGALIAGLATVAFARVPARTVLARLLVAEGFLVALLITLPFVLPGRPILSIFWLTASWEGLWRALAIILRINAGVLVTLALLGGLGSTRLAARWRALACRQDWRNCCR